LILSKKPRAFDKTRMTLLMLFINFLSHPIRTGWPYFSVLITGALFYLGVVIFMLFP
jgi:hypothetical protein